MQTNQQQQTVDSKKFMKGRSLEVDGGDEDCDGGQQQQQQQVHERTVNGLKRSQTAKEERWEKQLTLLPNQRSDSNSKQRQVHGRK